MAYSHVYFPCLIHAPDAASAPQNACMPDAQRLQLDEQRAAAAAALMSSPCTCQLIMVRHGETDWNKEGRLQGQIRLGSDWGPPLNPAGSQQAAEMARVLQQRYPHVDAVFSSDLLRAVQTAEVVAAAYGLQAQQHRGLRERHFGVLQGVPVQDMQSQPEAWAVLQSHDTSARLPGGGESMDDVQERATAAVLDIARTHAGLVVLLVGHGGVMHALHRAARGYPAKSKVFNCTVVELLAQADSACAQEVDDVTGSSSSSRRIRQQQESPQRQQQQQEGAAGMQDDDQQQQPIRDSSLQGDDELQRQQHHPPVWCDPSDPCRHCASIMQGLSGVGSSEHMAAASAAAAAAPGVSRTAASPAGSSDSMKQCGRGKVPGGRLAMLKWGA